MEYFFIKTLRYSRSDFYSMCPYELDLILLIHKDKDKKDDEEPPIDATELEDFE